MMAGEQCTTSTEQTQQVDMSQPAADQSEKLQRQTSEEWTLGGEGC